MRKNTHTLTRVVAMALLGSVALWPSMVGAAPDHHFDLQGIDAAVATAISTGQAASPSNVAGALSSELQALIAANPDVSPLVLAEAVIAAADKDGATPTEVGDGLAAAALAESQAVGLQIADAIGAVAPSAAVTAFENTANAGGGNGATLASAASTYETIGAGRGGNGNSLNFFAGTGAPNGNGGGGGCLNPSCT